MSGQEKRRPPSAAGNWPFGWFIGEVFAIWNDDGRTMTLGKPLLYVDANGNEWDAPEGSAIDGASIPRIAWTLVGGPFEGLYRDASVIHDVACGRRSRPWQDVHRAFYTAMRASQVLPMQAKMMYAAVYHFGPRWPLTLREMRTVTVDGRRVAIEKAVPPPPRTLTEADFPKLLQRIRGFERPIYGPEPKDLGLDYIENFRA